ncbi:DUF5694 domain-containing protein [Fictibacillus sp. BK138]|uniref:DUF5694 domain-containing protein n=1 Tax=Fictibacillus sp. BK138 TaxID=2512121 RepID=UPI001028A087|nr:DUF5694 domain-containing protein [Fictibacillus sp. BK138]RZT23631.1 hypothetical protein EV282_2725 [Fictibacillus sp. BK138]
MSYKKEIILVGTFHFEQDTELIKNKEDEIEELVDYFSKLQPTKVALEWENAQNEELNDKYKHSGDSEEIDEIQQIGFRLAQKLSHERVYAVNWAGDLTQNDMVKLNNTIQSSYPEILNTMNSLQESTPEISADKKLIQSYKELNDKKYIIELEKIYLYFVEVEDDKGDMIGVNFLNKWSERELMIFKNIVEIASDHSDERILLVIGSDHLWMLRKLFEGMGWHVINPFHIDAFLKTAFSK